MNMLVSNSPYPTHLFYKEVRDAIWEVQRNLQAPDALIAGSFLTAMSVACQGDIDLEKPTGQIGPTVLNILTIADSGERKTGTDRLVCAFIYDHDEMQISAYEAALRDHQSEHRYWKVIGNAIERKIAKAIGSNEDASHLRTELREHQKQEPRKPERQRIIHQDITERPLREALRGDRKSIAIMSDEGEEIVKGGAMKKMGVLNKAWDGARRLAFDRADGSLEGTNPRLTFSYMVQEGVFKEFMAKRGDAMRATGHCARYLVAHPPSTQGFRFMSLQEPVWEYLPWFSKRGAQLLLAASDRQRAGDTTAKLLKFSPEAKELWVQEQNYIEAQLCPGGRLFSIRDFASKLLEIESRIAAILHHFTDQAGNLISIETFQRAQGIAHWHLEEFLRLFGDQHDIPQHVKDVRALGGYLFSRFWCHGYGMAPRNDVRRDGPVRGGRFDAALNQLCLEGSVSVPFTGKKKRYIHLNPAVFSQIPVQY